jgi:predicted nuclease with TOPRIM domain
MDTFDTIILIAGLIAIIVGFFAVIKFLIDLKKEMKEFKKEIRTEIKEFKEEVRTEFNEVKDRLVNVEKKLGIIDERHNSTNQRIDDEKQFQKQQQENTNKQYDILVLRMDRMEQDIKNLMSKNISANGTPVTNIQTAETEMEAV